MGYKEIDIRVPVAVSDKELFSFISAKTRLQSFTYRILKKSLDARKKNQIVWLYRIGIVSEELKNGVIPEPVSLVPVYRKRKEHVVIAGSGPAGIFSALFLPGAGSGSHFWNRAAWSISVERLYGHLKPRGLLIRLTIILSGKAEQVPFPMASLHQEQKVSQPGVIIYSVR